MEVVMDQRNARAVAALLTTRLRPDLAVTEHKGLRTYRVRLHLNGSVLWTASFTEALDFVRWCEQGG